MKRVFQNVKTIGKACLACANAILKINGNNYAGNSHLTEYNSFFDK